MEKTISQYAKFAPLFAYPDADFGKVVRDVQTYLDETAPEAAEELREFTAFAEQASLDELEELYTRSFDVQAVTTLDLGYVLFGDDYKRGELLANLNREHREAGVDCGTELGDHLPNMLELLDAMNDPELRDELVQMIVAPALRRIIGEFSVDRIEKNDKVYMKHHKTLIEKSKHHGVIYEKTLKALYTVLSRDFDVSRAEAPQTPAQSCFLNSIGTEMTIDCKTGDCHGSTG